MTTISIEEAQAKLPEIIRQLHPGEEITITDHGQPLAQVKKADATAPTQSVAKLARPGPGLCRGAITCIAPDFDAPLEEMKEYMESA